MAKLNDGHCAIYPLLKPLLRSTVSVATVFK